MYGKIPKLLDTPDDTPRMAMEYKSGFWNEQLIMKGYLVNGIT